LCATAASNAAAKIVCARWDACGPGIIAGAVLQAVESSKGTLHPAVCNRTAFQEATVMSSHAQFLKDVESQVGAEWGVPWARSLPSLTAYPLPVLELYPLPSGDVAATKIVLCVLPRRGFVVAAVFTPLRMMIPMRGGTGGV